MSRSFLPHIDRMAGYEPGEQPREGGFIKLNTNENPYPPSPRVAAAIGEALNGRLRLYPDPLATEFRGVAAEAYAAFDLADHDRELLAASPNLIITRTLSKGYSLAGLRIGYLIARPEVVAGLRKVKDSYNCGTLSLVGGAAALRDQPYYQ